MNGALYGLPQGALMDPTTMGLMQAGLGMMGAGGPSRMPVSFGQAMNQGAQQGLNAYQQTQQGNMQQQMFGMKMEEAQRQALERQKAEAAKAQFIQQFPQFAPLLDINPKLATERAFPEQKPFKLSPGQTQYGPDNKPVVTAPQGPGNPSSLSVLIGERDKLPAGSPLRATYDDAIKKATTSQPLVNVDARQEGKFSETVGKEMGEQYSNILKADMNAPATIGKYQRLGGLLGQVNTGKFKGATTDLKAAAKSMGFDLTAMGIADDVAPAQAARALSNQIALELRNPAGGAGMPGALSDKDREFLIQSIPGLENDPAAVGKMIEYRVKLEQRAQKVARMARDYRKKNGRFDEGFYDQLQEYSDRNPLFSDAVPAPAAPAASGSLSPAEMTELEELRRRFKK
jgi:hypothetical protein